MVDASPLWEADLVMKNAILSLVLGALGSSIATADDDLEIVRFADHRLTPSPACLTVHANGDVYVGVDLNGSLKVHPGNGRIIKLVDSDNDGVADESVVFAEVGNPRGLIAVGEDVFVLHSIYEGNRIVRVDLSMLTDADQDGKADGAPVPLIKGISTLKFNNDRGVDHSTNGIAMGIDGWIYIAVGDFGFVDATDASGRKLTMLGGGVVRVRPDGTEMEAYTHGLRNIYDVAIDPFMNLFTRGNTNDGGGWNVRFIHHIQTGHYGYPLLYMHFTEEIIPALVDVGGGSGTGAMYLDEPTWPEKYNQTPLMCDWGKNAVFVHEVTPDGPTFTQEMTTFAQFSQPTDIAVDGSGRMYVSSWQGAGYKGNPGKGEVHRIVPKGWEYKPFPDVKTLSVEHLISGICSDGATGRLACQYELLKRGEVSAAPALLIVAGDTTRSLEARVSALFTYKQLLGELANEALLTLSKDDSIREWALRAAADRQTQLDGVSANPYLAALNDGNPRVQAAAAVALGRIGDPSVADALIDVAKPPALPARKDGEPGPHATPNAAVVIPHLAIHALVELKAVEASLAAIGGESTAGVLRALQLIHDPVVVDGLIARHRQTSDANQRVGILTALARLYAKEAPYDGSWWWKTRPDTRGPIYVPEKWSESDKIADYFDEVQSAGDAELVSRLQRKFRWNETAKKESGGKLAKSGDALVGDTSIEDVMLHLSASKGKAANGVRLPIMPACAQCHSMEPESVKRGPDLNDLGRRLTVDQIAESILKPEATISENWVELTKNDGATLMTTLVSRTDKELVVRDIVGTESTIASAEVKSVKPASSSVMPPHLVDGLTLDQFNDLVAYLASLKQ